MKHLFSFFFFSLLCIVTVFSQSWQFANTFGGLPGIDTDNSNEPYNLVVDNDDNTYIYGNYGELTTFNDSTLIHYNDGRKGNFLVKYSCDGNIEWSKAIANTENRDESASWMEIKDNHIFLQGHIYMSPEDQIFFLDTLVDGATLLENYPDNNTYPWEPYRNYTYIIKLDLDGNIIDYHLLSNYRDYTTSEHTYGVFNANTQMRIPFHIDNDGNFFLTAYLDNYQDSQIICDNLIITEHLPISETTFPQTYLLKFDSEFSFQWIKPMSLGVSDANINNTYIRFNDITNDSENNLYIAGSLSTSSTNIATYPIFVELENNILLESCMKSYKIGFILKYNSNGDLIWAKQSKNYGEHSFSEFESIVVNNNDIYIGGTATQVGYLVDDVGTIFGDNDTLITDAGMASNYTGFIAKYDTDGNYHWSFAPNSFKSFISNICVYNDDIYTSVLFETSLSHGDSTYMYVHPNPPYGVRGLALCSWDSNGLPLESQNIHSTCYENNYDLVPYQTRISSNGNMYLTGTLDSTLVFGDYSVSAGEDLRMFIAKFGTECPIVIRDNYSLNPKELITYPVPAISEVTIQIPNNKEISEYTIYDLQGKIISNKKLTCVEENFTIDIKNFLPGKYIILLTSRDDTYTGSFIKQ